MPRRTAAVLSIALALLASGCAAPAVGTRTDAAPHAAAPAPAASWSSVGASVEGRPIESITIGAGPRRILIIGAIHGDEPEGLPAIDPLIDHFAASPALRRAATVRIVRDANPDGTAAGSRGNARRIDLNRNWPASNFAPARTRGPQPLSEPETAALHTFIASFAPDLVLVFHSTPSGPFVNYDGPAERDAHAFADAAARLDPRWRVVPNIGYPTPGSLGSYLGVDLGVPILTIEFARRHDPHAARHAVSVGIDAILSGQTIE
ncbi:MAG: succinylglutamate desuccinylase/aspartoacylase family protein [Phycisphaerales bacterium]|nr:succinylglutamate desuccinylase/aspartoacylase family protein [Phycisphaerales bacterium]